MLGLPEVADGGHLGDGLPPGQRSGGVDVGDGVSVTFR